MRFFLFKFVLGTTISSFIVKHFFKLCQNERTGSPKPWQVLSDPKTLHHVSIIRTYNIRRPFGAPGRGDFYHETGIAETGATHAFNISQFLDMRILLIAFNSHVRVCVVVVWIVCVGTTYVHDVSMYLILSVGSKVKCVNVLRKWGWLYK